MVLFIITLIIYILFTITSIYFFQYGFFGRELRRGEAIVLTILEVILILCVGGTYLRTKTLPNDYKVSNTEIYRSITSENTIYKVWLEDKDGTYFWIDVDEEEFGNFTKGDTIELTQKEISNKTNSLK